MKDVLFLAAIASLFESHLNRFEGYVANKVDQSEKYKRNREGIVTIFFSQVQNDYVCFRFDSMATLCAVFEFRLTHSPIYTPTKRTHGSMCLHLSLLFCLEMSLTIWSSSFVVRTISNSILFACSLTVCVTIYRSIPISRFSTTYYFSFRSYISCTKSDVRFCAPKSSQSAHQVSQFAHLQWNKSAKFLITCV